MIFNLFQAIEADEKLKVPEVSENDNKDPLEAPVTPLPRVNCNYLLRHIVICI